LSPTLRLNYRDAALLELPQAEFEAVGIPTVEQELYRYLASLSAQPATSGPDNELVSTVRAYRDNGDILHLHRLVQVWPSYRLVRLVDVATDQSFLLIQPEQGSLPWIFNIGGSQANDVLSLRELDAPSVRRFARARQFCLTVRNMP
jgi:hypothetical protein